TYSLLLKPLPRPLQPFGRQLRRTLQPVWQPQLLVFMGTHGVIRQQFYFLDASVRLEKVRQLLQEAVVV
mgnify:CR=1